MGRSRLMIAVGGLALFFAGIVWGHFAAKSAAGAGEAVRQAETPSRTAKTDAPAKPASSPARPAQPKPIKKVCIMTDLEGVAGVRDSEQWCRPDGRYYDLGRKLLTLEVNAAIKGLLAGGAEEIVVVDGHGAGAVDIELLDRRAELERGWPSGWPGPSLAAGGFDAVAWVGQHAKAGTPYAHLAHTQGFNYLDLAVNGVSIGEFGQFALCASELGVRSILATGDQALTEEARALVPGIETVAVKRGTTPGRSDDLTAEQYGARNTAAIHRQPEAARSLIRAAALRAMRRAQQEEFGLIALKPPFERVARFRPKQAGQPALISRESHASSVIELMNLPFNPAPEQK